MLSAVDEAKEEDDLVSITLNAILALLYLLSYSCMVLNTYIVTSSNPTDPTVALHRLIDLHQQEDEAATLAARRTIDKNAIYFCDICQTNVMKNSKHCASCNRCCYEFDHHCIWVGNDVGAHNYKSFLWMLICTCSTLFLNFCLALEIVIV